MYDNLCVCMYVGICVCTFMYDVFSYTMCVYIIIYFRKGTFLAKLLWSNAYMFIQLLVIPPSKWNLVSTKRNYQACWIPNFIYFLYKMVKWRAIESKRENMYKCTYMYVHMYMHVYMYMYVTTYVHVCLYTYMYAILY